MFWGDVLKSYRNLLPSLPDEITLLHWGYDDSAEYDLTAAFVSSGHDTYVCPGTSGWKRILNAMDLAERNISTFADMGRQAGASGLLNTDWGDHGHFNMLASSWHGIALGACKGWRCDHPCGLEFDRILARNQWGMDDGACFSMLRQASALAAQYETWRLFWQPLGETGDELRSIPQEDIASMCAAAAKAKRFFSDHSSLESATQDDFVELHLACRFLDCFADKVEFAHAASRGNHGGSEGESIWHCFDDLIGMTRDFAACWLRRNKPSGLDDIRRALHAVREDLLTRATA